MYTLHMYPSITCKLYCNSGSLLMARLKKGQLWYKCQVPNEQFVYKTTPQQRPPLYKGQNLAPQIVCVLHYTQQPTLTDIPLFHTSSL